MSEIVKYSLLNIAVDKNKPRYDFKHKVLILPLKYPYRYFLEAKLVNNNSVEYYIFLSSEKFNPGCKLCKTNQYGQVQINIKGEMLDYVVNEVNTRSNIDAYYVESADNYDIFRIV